MILDEIAGKTKERVAKLKEITTMEELEKKAFSMEINNDFPFEKALSKKGLSFICEVRKKSLAVKRRDSREFSVSGNSERLRKCRGRRNLMSYRTLLF